MLKIVTAFALTTALAAPVAMADRGHVVKPATKFERLDNRLTRAELSGRIEQGTRADHVEDRIDHWEDRIDRRENRRDERIDLGPRDVIEDRLDRREDRRDRRENRWDRRAG